MQQLNIQQQLAVQAPEKPLLIVAGAGTGKTKTLTSRLVYLIEQGVSPEKMCALTFTNKAAKEMLVRVRRDLRERGIRQKTLPFVGTFHSLGARILRVEGKKVRRGSNFVIFDEADSLRLLKRIVKDASIQKLGPAFFRHKISQIKNNMIELEDVRLSPAAEDRLAFTIFERYEQELEKNNAFDFDDLIHKVVYILKTDPRVRTDYETRYAHVLVDEYQDLNNTQYEFIQLLTNKSKRLSVVGDDQQTIYSWRGSNYELFLNFEKHWPDAQVVFLEENYRSTGNIIRAASSLIEHNLYQKSKTLWTKKKEGAKIRLLEAQGEDDEAGWIAEEIKANGKWQRANGKSQRANSQAQIANGNLPISHSIAILYRTNAQSRAIEQALLAYEIPYRIFGGLKFYERREVKDILAALRYISNPKDSVSLERLEKTFSKAKLRALHEQLSLDSTRSPYALIKLVISQTEYFNYLEKNFTNAREREENVGELLRFARTFDDLSQFLERVSLLQDTDTVQSVIPASREPVHLMTVHLAKGLEFDEVFLVGASEGLLPHARSLENNFELEEERRLMYVAMTRAKEKLSISFYDLPSRFLAEIPEEFVEFESLLPESKFLDDSEERYITLD